MAQMVKTQAYNDVELDVVLNPDNLFEIGVQVGDTGIVANAEGKKIIPAGTPVGNSSASPLVTRNTVVIATNTALAGGYSYGVLRHDVDVTNGTANGTLVVRGEIDSSKCPVIVDEALAVLTHLIFVNGGSY